MVTFMLGCHLLMTVLMCVFFIESFVVATTTCWLVVFSFWTINYIALELEMPFGDDPNDLPIEEMQKDLNESLISLLRPVFKSPPVFQLYRDSADAPQLTAAKTRVGAHIEKLIEDSQTGAFFQMPHFGEVLAGVDLPPEVSRLV